jgi:uncharacterized membrane protein YdjX (TVP38/TMEM64 family)
MRAGLLLSAERRWPPALASAITRRRCAVACGVVALLVLASLFIPLRSGVAGFAAWARGAGALGIAAFAAAHVLCALLLVPSWPLRVSAGFVYGGAWGFGLGLSSSLAGAILAFLASRLVLRDRVVRRIASEPRLMALDEAIAANGLWTVFLLRLSPVFPNELVNYALGATRIGLRDYALASLVGMLPLTASYAWLGSLLTAVGDLAGSRPVATGVIGQLIWWSGLATTIALAVASTQLARGALERALGARGARRDLGLARKDRAGVLVSDG